MKALYLIAMTATFVIKTACAQAAGDAARGARVFQACAACHSVQPGEHMTGPSLADVWNRKQWSIRINDQWRVCFRFERGDAFDVEIADYH